MDEILANDVQGNATFLCSAGEYSHMPEPKGEEYCILGRSNVGKSSFLNHVLQSGNLARVSKKPGKTNLANFFKITENVTWVDLPGYGYARASRSEKMRWSRLIGDYCKKRENLCGVLWLLDIRHCGLEADMEAATWIKSLQRPVFPILTKSDKLNQSDRIKHLRAIKEFYRFIQEPLLFTVQRHKTRDVFWQWFSQWRSKLSIGGEII